MFRVVIFWSILFLSITSVYSLRGGLIRNGRAFNDGGENSPLESYQLLFFPSSQNRGYQEFMRFGRSADLPGAHQNFYRGRRDTAPATPHQNFFRGRRDDSDEAESARFG
uniref:Uncharacterized protein n=1 Tax=Panagrolaimus superbus TaxID=310955 RepID=A0A914XWV6_9BILA